MDTSYAADFSPTRYSDENLRKMCDEGAARRKPDQTIRFNVFNKAEAEVVQGYMSERWPDVPFFISRVV